MRLDGALNVALWWALCRTVVPMRARPGPVMVADKNIAWPAQLALGGDGLGNSLAHIQQIM